MVPNQFVGERSIFAPAPPLMIVRNTVPGLCAAAMISLVLAPFALAGPAGDEYLPKIPQSGAHSASGSSASSTEGTIGTTGTTTLPETTSGSGSEGKSKDKGKGKKSKDTANLALPASSGTGGSGGDDSSGSILLNPIVLLVIAAVIAAVVGMTLRRRQIGGDAEPESKTDPGSPSAGSPRTPDGEIVANRDQAA
jgi:hypothetical protein